MIAFCSTALFEFFQPQNHFSHEWLNLFTIKQKYFAHCIQPRLQLQKNFCLFINSVIQEKSGSEWGIISPKKCTIRCQTLYFSILHCGFVDLIYYTTCQKLLSRNFYQKIKHEYLRSRAYICLSLSSPSSQSYSNYATIEILVLVSWIPASKNFDDKNLSNLREFDFS